MITLVSGQRRCNSLADANATTVVADPPSDSGGSGEQTNPTVRSVQDAADHAQRAGRCSRQALLKPCQVAITLQRHRDAMLSRNRPVA